ncbi:transcriptional regulator, TetR family [Solidesulfovibrio fructosivorans JJ]]|uniref:Transcriptional regulator, TetR family n=1 Tax=Solidesulfovibrio fructosivorans JJ] TaxID=596151 RepID=E1JXD3_SOLFR|nr:TetR/AcrR family transcriptional regulator [Solidesulfovibrio fructosivorans]EFL50910.1 transcriptional regulator, TetR family [Solidesulfovibrio fructosivorans JJ]]
MSPSGMTRKEAAEQTRRKILEAAKEIYAEPENADTPISRVARRAGVAEGTVFAHFPDKPSLLAAAFQDEIERVLAQAWAAIAPEAPCRDKLMGLVRPLYAFYAKRPALYRVLVKESLFLQGEWGRKVMEFTLHFVAQVAELMETAKRRNEYRRDVDCRIAARGFFGLYFIELLSGLSDDAFDPDATAHRFEMGLCQFERGLLTSREMGE